MAWMGGGNKTFSGFDCLISGFDFLISGLDFFISGFDFSGFDTERTRPFQDLMQRYNRSTTIFIN